MGTTQPIKSKEELKTFMEYYNSVHPVPRNYALVIFGLHTALRISDILNLQWKDVFDFPLQIFQTHLNILEKKTGKQKYLFSCL